MKNEKLLVHHQQNKITKPREDTCYAYNRQGIGIKNTLHTPINQ